MRAYTSPMIEADGCFFKGSLCRTSCTHSAWLPSPLCPLSPPSTLSHPFSSTPSPPLNPHFNNPFCPMTSPFNPSQARRLHSCWVCVHIAHISTFGLCVHPSAGGGRAGVQVWSADHGKLGVFMLLTQGRCCQIPSRCPGNVY